MIVFGGFEEENQRFSQETFAFDFTTRKWSEFKTEGTPPQHRDFHAACMVDNKMFVFGGKHLRGLNLNPFFTGRCDERGQFHSSIDFYDNAIHFLDLTTLTWTTPLVKNTPPPGRRSNTLWSYAGRVFMFGGYESKNSRHFSDLYRFDPQERTWTKLKPAGQNPAARRRQCSVMVGNRLFLFGGTRPHETRRNMLVDLGDLNVLDYGNAFHRE
jgi:N-acetylneuraminic acid mutarotase